MRLLSDARIDVGQADQLNPCALQPGQVSAGNDLTRHRLGADAAPHEQVREHRRRGLIEAVAGADAQNGDLLGGCGVSCNPVWLRTLLLRQIVDDADGILGDALDGLPVDTTAQPVLLGKAKGRQDDQIIKFVEELLLEVLLGELGRLIRVARQQALVELDLGGQRRLVAQEHVEETELGNMAP